MTDQPEAIDPDAALIVAMLKAWTGLPQNYEIGFQVGAMIDMGKSLAIVREREVAPLKAQNARLRQALTFYADTSNWRTAEWGDEQETPGAIPVLSEEGSPCDCGDIARAALTPS